MNQRLRRQIQGVLIAAILTLGVALLRAELGRWMGDRSPLMPFLLAVLAAAWRGGLWPGILATVAGALTGSYLFITPTGPFLPDATHEWISMAFFAAIGALVSWSSEALIVAREREEVQRQKLERAVLDLRKTEAEQRVDRDQIAAALENVRTQAELLDLAHDAILVRSAEGVISSWNKGAERMYGWPREKAVGQVSHTLLGTIFPRPLPEIEAELARGGWWEGNLVHTRQDGTRIVVASRWVLRENHGNPRERTVLEINNEITQQLEAERALRESEAQQRAIVENAVDGIITIDDQGIVVTVNPAVTKIFGYSADQVVGQNVSMLMPAPYRSEHDGYLAHYRQTGERRIIGIGREVAGRRQDGSEFPLELAVSEAHLGDRRLFTGIVRDVSERKRAEAALKDADRMRDEFLAVLSHELRNPLAPIRNAIKILKKATGVISEGDLMWSRDVLDRQVRHLSRLVDDLLDNSRIRAGKLNVHREHTEFAAIIESAVETSQPLIRSAGHRLTVTLPEETIYLEADPIRLSQVFSNLLNNAARYTEQGGEISLTSERQGSDVVVTVADTGIGISPEMLPRVFEVFEQESSSRSQGGLGLGLSLARGLVEMHGGSIEAHSDGPGRGSRFMVRLPIALGSRPASKDGDALFHDAIQEAHAKHRILIADDLRDAADSLAILMRITGHQVEVAYDGEQALKVAEALWPDVVLLDIGMPRVNGYEAARWLRAQPWGKTVYLIAVTGWGKEDDRQRTKEAGFDAHIVKPVALEELANLIGGLPAPPARRLPGNAVC